MLAHALEHPRSALWVPMGAGKSVVTLSAIDILQLSGEDRRPALVLAPLRVAQHVWPDEVAKWTHLNHIEVEPILGSPAQRLKALRSDHASVFTTNYENLEWLVDQFRGAPWPFGTLVLDEATKLKSLRVSMQTSKTGKQFLTGQGSVRAKALASVSDKFSRVVELTGTPSPNGLKDLWGQLWFLDQGQRLGRTFEGFKGRWFQQSFDGYGMIPLPFAHDQIMERCHDLCLSIELPPMPDPIVSVVPVDLPPKARAIYAEMEKRMFAEVHGHEVEAFGAAARTMKCLQMANGAVYVGEDNNEFVETHDAKLQALESIVNEAAGAPVLVAYHFKSDLARLKKAFPHGLDIATPEGLRRAKKGEGTVWFGHPASIGHGVDGLAEHCNIAAFFGHWWDLEQYLQFVGRIGPVRQLQTGRNKAVFLHFIVATDTVDEAVVARRDSKTEVQDVLMNYMKRKQRA
jgi:hypothetical protein